MSSCCPPGSWEGPLSTEGPSSPKGSMFTFPGSDLTAYYTMPPSQSTSTTMPSSTKGIVVFHDVWGLLPRLLSICDALAEKGGYHVIAPDCFRGTTKDDAGDDMLGWLKKYPYSQVEGDIKLCRDFLQTNHGVDTFGAMGFCWGGWAIAKSAAEGSIAWKVAVSPHPSFILESKCFDGDEDAMMDKIDFPFLILPGGNDPAINKPGSDRVNKLEAKGGKSIPFEDMVHGWTTRSDLTDPNTKAQVEKALTLSFDFFKEHL